MIQAGGPARLHYAARRIGGAAAEARLPRAVQSEAAEALSQEVSGGHAGNRSKAHARGWVAAASASEGRVGIDLEFHAPGRDIRAIVRWLMDADAPDDASAYRVFTFREAYFKAMGALPAQALLRAAAAGESRFGAARALFETPAPDFTLALVWDGNAVPVQR